jgi:hypothetical protein
MAAPLPTAASLGLFRRNGSSRCQPFAGVHHVGSWHKADNSSAAVMSVSDS